MEPESPAGGTRRGFRRWQRWLLALFLLPFIVFGLSNLLLNSGWFLGKLTARFEARTTLDAHIGGASWSPWNGATLREIRIEQPAVLQPLVGEPLIRIAQVRINPIWRSWLRGRLEIKSIDLKSPRVVLPLELISHFAPPPSAAPQTTATDGRQTPATDPAATPPATPQSAANPPAGPPTAATPGAPAAPAPNQRTTGYFNLSDASFALVFGGHKTPLAESRGISGAIPVGGGPAESSLLIGALDFLGQASANNLRLPLKWQPPLITIGPTEAEIAGLKTKVGGQLGLLNGLPLVFEIAAPQQSGKPIALGGNSLQAAEISATSRFAGLLMSPATWQGDFVTAAAKPVINFNGKETRFDHVQMINTLRNGALSCADFRLVGDELSLLGNGTLHTDGKLAAVLRVVAPPDTTTAIVQQLFPGIQAPPAYSAMSTPQRVALDLEAFGSLGNLQIRLGKNGPLADTPKPPATVPSP